MGDEVGRGLAGYNNPGLAGARGRYAAWLAREVRRLYLERAFDVIILPSDAFFYVRTLPAAAHRLGIPVVVVQKETTVSYATMETFTKEVAAEAPFVSDWMTVCSDRQREFWMRAGADPALIEITGQPRFDLYAAAPAVLAPARRRVLFLTYALDAYVPGAGRGQGLRTWEPLRTDTEAALLELARAHICDVVVKCHPQQDRRHEAERVAKLAGPAWNHGISVAAADADTRDLIIDSDVVVGFQTTAMYEAVAARRSVIYAAWGAAYELHREGLIPFDAAPHGCLRHAGAKEILAAMITDTWTPQPSGCGSWYEEALGPVDGHAADRVAERLTGVAGSWKATDLRHNLDRQRRRFAIGLFARSLATETMWTAARPVARISGQQQRVARRRRHAANARHMATAALTGRGPTRGAG